MFREAGAIEVHGRISFSNRNSSMLLWNSDRDRDQLMASSMTVEEMRAALGMDTLEFLSRQNLTVAIGTTHCNACFGGDYPTKTSSKPAVVVRSSPVPLEIGSKVFEK